MDNLSQLNMKEDISYIWQRVRRRLGLIFTFANEGIAELLMKFLYQRSYVHSRPYILEKIQKEHAKAYYNFKPLPIKTRITLFHVSRQPRNLIPDPTLGWADFSESGVVDFEIHAFHQNILKDPNVKALAQRLQQCLDEAQRSLDKDLHVA